MKKRVTKLIGLILAASMLTSSVGIVSWAEEEAAGSTEAVEAIAETAEDAEAIAEDAAEETEAVSEEDSLLFDDLGSIFGGDDAAEETPDDSQAGVTDEAALEAQFAEDSYYQEAMGLLVALGVFSGYEDGSLKPGSTITRAEMATVILKSMNITEYAPYVEGTFTDVATTDWHANIVMTAKNKNIIAGYPDGEFKPNDPVTYAQAIKMAVCALGYGSYAEYIGGWYVGYMNAASKFELTDHAAGAPENPAPRGLVAKVIYNMLCTDYPQFQGYEPASNTDSTPVPKFQTNPGETMAYVMFGVEEIEDIIDVTSGASMVRAELLPAGRVSIGGEICFDTTGNLDSMIAQKVKAFYKEDEAGNKTIIYAIPTSKNETKVIAGTLIDEIEMKNNMVSSVKYYQSETSSSTRTINKFDDPVVIYNGQYLSVADVDDYITTITPQVGSMTFIDNDGDGEYEVISIEKYETMIVAAATTSKITGKMNGQDEVTIDVDPDDDTIAATIIKAGAEVRAKNLQEDDVASIKRSLSDSGTQTIIVNVSGETFTGSVSKLTSNDMGTPIAIVDGEQYKVDPQIVDDITLKTPSTFYLDIFGRICNVVSESSGKLEGSEKYGWIMKTYKNEEDMPEIRMYTQDNKVVEYTLASKVKYWSPDAVDYVTVSGSDLDTFLNIPYATAGSDTYRQIRLVKYTVNSSNEIKQLYVATSDTSLADDGAVTFNAGVDGASSIGNVMGGAYLMKDGFLEFFAPENVSDAGDETLYSVGEGSKSTYLNKEGNGIFCVPAELDETSPTVMIRFNGNSDSPNTDIATASGYTAGDHQTFMVTKVKETINSDDEPIFQLEGYTGGAKVTFTTTTQTSVYCLNQDSLVKDTRYYDATWVWDGKNSEVEEFYDYVKPGDVFTFLSSGSNILCMAKLVDVEQLAEQRIGLWNSYGRFSDTRDGIAFGPVTGITRDSEATITVAGNTFAFDSAKALDGCTINVDEDGNFTGTLEFTKDDPFMAVDVDKYDGEYGDYAFIRTFKGDMREIFIYRFEN